MTHAKGANGLVTGHNYITQTRATHFIPNNMTIVTIYICVQLAYKTYSYILYILYNLMIHYGGVGCMCAPVDGIAIDSRLAALLRHHHASALGRSVAAPY